MVDMASGSQTLLSIEQVEQRVQEQTRAKRARDRRAELVYPVLLGAVILAIWEFGTRALHVTVYLFPASHQHPHSHCRELAIAAARELDHRD